MAGQIRKQASDEIAPGEAVGVLAAQSIGEPGTQMSLAHSERVIVRTAGAVAAVPIGEFVDELMHRYPLKRVEGAEVCDVSSAGIEVPSLEQGGRIQWKNLLECSRHKANELLRITTRSGRSITATPYHSFVVRKNGSMLPVAGSSLKAGDRIPAIRSLSIAGQRMLDMGEYLPKEQFWFGSELRKALALGSGFRSGYGTAYTVPAGIDAVRHYVGGEQSVGIEDGYVYPYQNHSKARIPETMELDASLGWFVGAYIAEGTATRYHVSISNTDEAYLAHARAFAKRLNLVYHEYDNERGFSRGHDLNINSSLLSEFMRRSCGHLSAKKRVPDFAFGANAEFVGALLRAYFDGDGNVSVQRSVIRASSSSKELIDGVALLLARFGIFARKSAGKKGYALSVSHRDARKFRGCIGTDIAERKPLIDALCARAEREGVTYDVVEMVTGFGDALQGAALKLGFAMRMVNKFTRKQRIGRATLERYVRRFEELSLKKGVACTELQRLRALLEEDVVWDEIVRIERASPADRVYDFSVEGLETFATFDGLITHNTMRTFHYAGVAEQVPLGLPRLIEIVDARKTPKEPMMDVYLKPEYAKDAKKARNVTEQIEELHLSNIAAIRENFARKEIDVAFNDEKLREEGLDRASVVKKIKAALNASAESTDAGVMIKPKVNSLLALRKFTSKLRELHIAGVKRITRAVVIKSGDEHYIRTGGSNLAEIMKLPFVDARRCYTNDIIEIEKVLGIEAARNAIVREAKQVLDMQGLDVDAKHLMLMADAMCMDGSVKSIGRHGLSGQKASILARAAFEETLKHLLTASVKGDRDDLVSVTENIIAGQLIPVGTGIIKLAVKPQKPKKEK
jgi:DNA-directed RNA polymerase subunit A"